MSGVRSVIKRTIGKNYFLGVATLPYVGWTLGTLLGALAGDILPIIITSALGIALYSMFIAIIIPPAQRVVFQLRA